MKSFIFMLLLTFSGMLYANTVATNVAFEETEIADYVDVGVESDFYISSVSEVASYDVESPHLYNYSCSFTIHKNYAFVNYSRVADLYNDSGGGNNKQYNYNLAEKNQSLQYRRARDGLTYTRA